MKHLILVFGCAIVLLGAIPARSQDSYANVTALRGSSESDPYVVLQGYYNPTGAGGGILVLGPSGCSDNGGTVFVAHGSNNCYYRTNPTNDVREWGAYCDVQSVSNSKANPVTWNPTVTYGGYTGAIQVPDSVLAALPVQPAAKQFITATQIGDPPMWADRWSTVGNQSGSSNYKINDLISFQGVTDTGTFSQQLAIVVDQVADATGNTLVNSGEIWKWHFIWGGQYTAIPDATMTVDLTRSVIATGDTSATFIPAWSGWSAMDSGTGIAAAGSGYSPGATVTFSLAGGTVNQGHYPEIVVLTVSGGAVETYAWLDYGSFSAIPSSLTTYLVQSGASCSPGCSGLELAPEWTRGALATTIVEVTHDSNCVHGFTCIFPTNVPPGVPTSQPIEGLYYGDDDGTAINTALADSPNAASVHVSGFCGTTVPIKLPDNAGVTTPTNAALVGDEYKSSGIFAFAYDNADTSDYLLMNHAIYAGGGNLAFGGGLRDLEIEGGGVPQGYGYYGLSTGTVGAPMGYSANMCSPCQESTGSTVEIDYVKESIFRNLAIYDAYGEGNAMFQAGVSEANPQGNISADFGSVFVNSIRTGITGNQIGALDPEFSINFQSAHDSQFSNLVAFDGTEAHIFENKGNIYNGAHIESDVLNGVSGNPSIDWAGIGPLAGVALYGVESPTNLLLNNLQCDFAWLACIFLGEASPVAADVPAVITNVVQKCGGIGKEVPSTYYGVEVAAGTVGAAISNVVGGTSCGIPNTQLVHYDGPIGASVQAVSQSPSAQFCAPSLGFQPGRFYTTPFTSASSFTVAANTLYVIPVQIPCTVTVTELSTYVITGAPSKSCEYGIYGNNGAGQPGALILDAGNTSVGSSSGTRAISGLSQQLAPGLIFLVVGCNGTPTLNAGSTTGTLLGSLVGLTAPTDTSAVEESTAWTFGALPTNFPAVTYAATAPPLVYLTP